MSGMTVAMRNVMGRKAAYIGIQNEDWNPVDSQCLNNFAAASAILMKIAARIDARKAAANSDPADTTTSVECCIEPETLTSKDTTE